MKRSRRELFIDMVIHRGIFENNQITLFPCIFIPKTGVSFNWTVLGSHIPVLCVKVKGKTVIGLFSNIN